MAPPGKVRSSHVSGEVSTPPLPPDVSTPGPESLVAVSPPEMSLCPWML